jgi:CRISPR-associated protein Cmr3
MTTFTIQPHDAAVARDGRPFAAGLRMKSLSWLYPSVVAGSLRTLMGKAADPAFPPEQVERLKEIRVQGPLPLANRELFFPAPLDLAIDAKTSRCIGARPRPVREGDRSNLPTGLDPVMLPEEIEEDFKPTAPPAFWACGRMMAWLLNASGQGFAIPDGPEPPQRRAPASGYLDAPAQEERTHTAVASDTSTAEESMLFQTVGLRFDEEVSLAARAETGNRFAAALAALDTIHPLGGERRLAHWQTVATDAWNCPDDMRTALGDMTPGAKVRMVLATPALFDGGWRPGWLDAKTLCGTPPGLHHCELKLKGASVGRWQAISGYSLEMGKTGPKEMRRLAPAGSVYFFELVGRSAAELADRWLKPVSDRPADQGDGFGLALWGIWSE